MKSKVLSIALGLSLAMTASAKADTYIYHDTIHNFTFSYPDTWRLNTPAGGTQRVRITPMHGEDMVECTMDAVKDGRLTIYPDKYMKAAVPLTLDDSFWATDVLPNLENVRVHKYHPAAGLGQGFATSVQVTYGYGDVVAEEMTGMVEEEGVPTPITADIVDNVEVVEPHHAPKMVEDKIATTTYRANMIASIYKDYRYVFTCKAEAEAFDKWLPIFASITSSVRYDSRYSAFPTGFYRAFLNDKPLLKNLK